ncbi:MAG: tryptophan--tRNA ligase, partial [Cyanobacteria bacterium J06626_18]
QEKFQALMDDRAYLESVLKQGREKAEAIALETLGKAKNALGYSQPL